MSSTIRAFMARWNPSSPLVWVFCVFWVCSDGLLYLLGPSPTLSAIASCCWMVWFGAGKKMTLLLAVLAMDCIASR